MRDELFPYSVLTRDLDLKIKERDFERHHSASLYGKSNYTCSRKGTNCTIGSALKPKCTGCTHQKAREFARDVPNVILNYHLGLSSFAFTTTFKPRKLMVCDEAHQLESILVDFDAIQITYFRCDRYKLRFQTFTDMLKAQEWVKSYYQPEMHKIHSRLEAEAEIIKEMGGKPTKKHADKISEYNGITEHVELINHICNTDPTEIGNQYVLVHDKKMFQFKRLTGAHSFNSILKSMASKFLFMSSTFLSKNGFCDDLKIPRDETAFLSLESEFTE